MKKNDKLLIGIIAGVMALALVIGCVFGGIYLFGDNGGSNDGGTTIDGEEQGTDIQGAIDYLKNLYKDEGSATATDYKRFNVIRIAGAPYQVVWTTNVSEDLVKIVDNGDGTCIVVVNKECTEETPYELTATISADGKDASHTWNYKLPKGESMVSIVDEAYALEVGEAMESEKTLTGVIVSIDTPYDENYKNVTVTIQVKGREDKPIKCYRLKGDGAEILRVDQEITVTGILKNYNGTIEFDAGCTLAPIPGYSSNNNENDEDGDKDDNQGDDKDDNQGGNKDDNKDDDQGNSNNTPTQPSGKVEKDQAKILKDAFALAEGASLKYSAQLKGKITTVENAYSEQYNNITVVISVGGKEIKCYRLTGDAKEMAKVAKGDTITVTGVIKNYNGTVEFDQGCVMDKRVSGGGKPIKVETDYDKILDAAEKLERGEKLAYNVQMKGQVVSISEKWSDQYGSLTVLLDVNGRYITAYRAQIEEGSDINGAKIDLGDWLTVYGQIINYNGTIEFNFPNIDEWKDGTLPKKEMKVVTGKPKVGKAYKYGMVQKNLSSTDVYYLIGGMSGYYMSTATASATAIDVYLEETKGGYYMYVKQSGKKLYLTMKNVIGDDGKEHISAFYEEKASTVFTYDEEHNAMVSEQTKDGKTEPYWFGTNAEKTYTTVGPVAVAYNGFYCQFYEEK